MYRDEVPTYACVDIIEEKGRIREACIRRTIVMTFTIKDRLIETFLFVR